MALQNVSDPSGQGTGVQDPQFAMPPQFQIKDGDSQETINRKRQLQSTWQTMGDEAANYAAGAVVNPSSF
jgi:hypothetical protein